MAEKNEMIPIMVDNDFLYLLFDGEVCAIPIERIMKSDGTDRIILPGMQVDLKDWKFVHGSCEKKQMDNG